MFLGDFHVHSTFSDGKLTIPELVDLYGSHGFGALAITDHLCEEVNWLGGAARLLERTLTPASFPLYINILRSEARRAWDQYGLVLIPGFELTRNRISNRRSAHILALGVEEYIAADQETRALCREIRSKGGLAVAAHPVHTGKKEKQTYHLWDQRESLREEFDAWEVASGSRLFSEVFHSGFPIVASSDLHRREQFRSWKTVIHAERDRASILQAIREQRISLQYFSGVSTHEASWVSLRLGGTEPLHSSLGSPHL